MKIQNEVQALDSQQLLANHSDCQPLIPFAENNCQDCTEKALEYKTPGRVRRLGNRENTSEVTNQGVAIERSWGPLEGKPEKPIQSSKFTAPWSSMVLYMPSIGCSYSSDIHLRRRVGLGQMEDTGHVGLERGSFGWLHEWSKTTFVDMSKNLMLNMIMIDSIQ